MYLSTSVLSKKETMPSEGMRERIAKIAQMINAAFKSPIAKPSRPLSADATDHERTIFVRIFSTTRRRIFATIKITTPEISNPRNCAATGATTCAKVFDMLEAATLGGARALHWDDEIGSLEIGKCADMIAVDLSGIECGPVTDPAAQLLYSAGREHVTHVWVAGRLAAGEGTEPRDDTARTLLEKWAPLI